MMNIMAAFCEKPHVRLCLKKMARTIIKINFLIREPFLGFDTKNFKLRAGIHLLRYNKRFLRKA